MESKEKVFEYLVKAGVPETDMVGADCVWEAPGRYILYGRKSLKAEYVGVYGDDMKAFNDCWVA
jgi:hypothetical protein